MTTRLVIILNSQERSALGIIAKQELREPREQARFILREEFLRRGLLSSEAISDSMKQKGSLDDER